MSGLEVSVVVPSYNKRHVLAETLHGIEMQTAAAGRYEVIVVDDGSTDGTADMLEGYRPAFRFRWVSQPNLGAGAARNLGASIATAGLLLFLDGDIVGAPGLLAAHLKAQRARPGAVVGRVLPLPGNPQAGVHAIFDRSFDLGPDPRDLTPGLGISGNLSIGSRAFAELGGFDARLRRGQDVEFSQRATARGVALYYEPSAVSHHNHVLSLEELLRKVQADHMNLVALFNANPAAVNDFPYLRDKLPVDWGSDTGQLAVRKATYRAMATPPVRQALKSVCGRLERWAPDTALLESLAWKLLGAYQWLGLREGMKRYGWRPDGPR